MFHYLLFNQGSHIGIFKFKSLQNLETSWILLLLFNPRESASHNDYSALIYFYEVDTFPIDVMFNILFDGNFSDATCLFGFSTSQEDLKLTTDTNNHFEDP